MAITTTNTNTSTSTSTATTTPSAVRLRETTHRTRALVPFFSRTLTVARTLTWTLTDPNVSRNPNLNLLGHGCGHKSHDEKGAAEAVPAAAAAAGSASTNPTDWYFSPASAGLSPAGMSTGLSNLLGTHFIEKSNPRTAVAMPGRFAGAVVAVYFSAHWCPPCRQYTPMLANFYAQAKKANIKFEVVFVSRDKSEGEMHEYLSEMPWLALSYNNPLRDRLPAQFQVNGIPHLKIFSSQGVLLDNDAVSKMSYQNLVSWSKGISTMPQGGHNHSGHSHGGGCCSASSGGGCC